RRLALDILSTQLRRQVLPDGVYVEQSTYYHRYTADFYLHAYLLSREHAVMPEPVFVPALSGLLDYLTYVTRPDGSSPLIGDDDGGRLIPLGERAPNDFRDTLAVGAVLLDRADCAFVAGEAAPELLRQVG